MTVSSSPTVEIPAPESGPSAPFLVPRPSQPLVRLPESLGYRIKSKLLGPPLHTERLEEERLGIPTALAVFSSDCISSSAYATEEILRVLIPAVGVFAFSLVLPVTVAMIVVLFFLILSYRETIKEYPTAGGAYMVTRDNFGLMPAQIAGVSLLTDYILTVAVSTAAGTAAITSVFPALQPYTLLVSVGFVAVIALGNLKGVKESGKIFAVPTYFFMLIMGLMLVMGIAKVVLGSGLQPIDTTHAEGIINFKRDALGNGLLYGASLYVVLHAFASGGAAVTGVEAISNGVTAFKKPEWKNARVTLIIMGATLGTLFFGLSALATRVHPVPYESGSPTVISQVGKAVFGGGVVGHLLFLMLQGGTMMILVLAANTSFADFPRLASFHAGDNFMPKQLTKRGHRLVFSNGILALAGSSTVLLIATDAKVDRLIPLYAIGVFTSFTMSQAGMAKHHITKKEPGWRKGLAVNATGAVLSLIVDVIILITKFTHGAWVIVVFVPIMVAALMRLNRQYETERHELVQDVPRSMTLPILRNHKVVVLIDEFDKAAARAVQYARALNPSAIRAVHFDLDPVRTADLASAWSRLGLSSIALDVIECPDRRITRAAAEVAAQELYDGETEVTVLIPRREYIRTWHSFLHDKTANSIAATLSTLPHCNVTFVPYHLGTEAERVELVAPTPRRHPHRPHGRRNEPGQSAAVPVATHDPADDHGLPAERVPLGALHHRQRALVAGRVHMMRVQPFGGVPSLEVTLVDSTGTLLIVFTGRRQIPGIRVGARLSANGSIGLHHGRLAMFSPLYDFVL